MFCAQHCKYLIHEWLSEVVSAKSKNNFFHLSYSFVWRAKAKQKRSQLSPIDDLKRQSEQFCLLKQSWLLLKKTKEMEEKEEKSLLSLIDLFLTFLECASNTEKAGYNVCHLL